MRHIRRTVIVEEIIEHDGHEADPWRVKPPPRRRLLRRFLARLPVAISLVQAVCDVGQMLGWW